MIPGKNSLVFLFALIFCATISVNSAAQSDDEVLMRFDRHTGIPDHVMLPKFVKLIATSRDEEEHEGHNHGVQAIQRNLSLDSYEEAEALMDYLVDINKQIVAAKTRNFRENVCTLDLPRPTGAAVFDKMNVSNSHIDTLGQQYLDQIKADLRPPTYDLFSQWMNRQKSATLIVRYDYRHVYRDRDANMVRQEVCGKFDSAMSRTDLGGSQ